MKTGYRTLMRIWKVCPASSSSQGRTLLEKLSPGTLIHRTTSSLIKVTIIHGKYISSCFLSVCRCCLVCVSSKCCALLHSHSMCCLHDRFSYIVSCTKCVMYLCCFSIGKCNLGKFDSVQFTNKYILASNAFQN